MFLLVPLSDIRERRRLIVVQFGLIALALSLAAIAPNAVLLLIASLLLGMAASVAQQILPFASHLVPPERRGQTVGTILAGILTGILLSRTLSGFVATYAGWRAMFWLGVPLALGAGAMMRLVLPRSLPVQAIGYPALIASIAGLWRRFPTLRLAASTQALLFAAFTSFWTVLAFRLEAPPFGLGADVAGLFGVIGVVGIFAAPLAGRSADRRGAGAAVLVAALATLSAWLIFGFWNALAGLVVGVILLDFATQVALVSNQHIVFALDPEARGRLNTVLVGTMFLGGAFGSAAGSFAWAQGGWPAVSALGVAFGASAALLQMLGRRRA